MVWHLIQIAFLFYIWMDLKGEIEDIAETIKKWDNYPDDF